MRSLELFRSALGKELRELAASRAYWLLLLMIGPLVGHAFITAIESYAEVSAGALPQGLSPLDGILVPTFGAYDIAVTLLFPFVAIRLVSSEKESGALKLILQMPAGLGTVLSAKAAALLIGWLAAWIPGFAAVVLWRTYGGSVYVPELLNLLLGHLLRVILSSGVAVAAAAMARNAASAAIATLGFTVGTWALEFVAEGRGGWLHAIAEFTPTAALRVFEQGEFQASTAVVMLLVGLAGFLVAAVWLPARRMSQRIMLSVSVIAALGAAAWAGSMLRASADVSENRRNSFSRADEAALRQIREPLLIAVNLAPEDPRRMDLDRNVLSKLRRILPRVDVEYSAQGRSGLFGGDHYGEVWYSIGERSAMTRSATEPIVLETIYKLARTAPPTQTEEDVYRGHPLTAKPVAAAWIYYCFWPLVVVAGALLDFRGRN